MNPIIIALDCETAAETRTIVDATSKSVGYYKVGLELYAAAGMEFVRELLKQRKDVAKMRALYPPARRVGHVVESRNTYWRSNEPYYYRPGLRNGRGGADYRGRNVEERRLLQSRVGIVCGGGDGVCQGAA